MRSYHWTGLTRILTFTVGKVKGQWRILSRGVTGLLPFKQDLSGSFTEKSLKESKGKSRETA